MTGNEPKVDPEVDEAINRALDAAHLRPGDATTTSTLHPEPGDSAIDDGIDAGDGD